MGKTAFIFPGQGAQYVGMAASLRKSEPVFREHLERGLAVLEPRLRRAVSPRLPRPIAPVTVSRPGPETPLPAGCADAAPARVRLPSAAVLRKWRLFMTAPDVGSCPASCRSRRGPSRPVASISSLSAEIVMSMIASLFR